MDFKFNKRKLNYTVLISFFATIFSLYIFYPEAIQKTNIAEEGLRTMSYQSVFYLFVFFIVLYVFWLIVLYVVWSLFEE